MIKVKKNNKKICITGHALYDTYGKDIVCASVSSIIYTTVNALFKINKESIEYNDDGNTIEIINLRKDEITNKLLDNMIELLHQLEIDYPKNIKIESEE